MKSIGTLLRNAREEKKITLEEAHSETKIHLRILNALEEDKADEILVPPYVKGFLKRYTQYLGLNTEAIINQYLSQMPVVSKPVLSFEKKKTPRLFPGVNTILKIGFIAVATVCFLFYVRITFRSIFIAKEHLEQRTTPPKVASTKPTVSEFPVSSDELLMLTVTATQDSWMRVKSDEKTVFQNVLTKGSEERWEATEKIELWIGNAAGIELDLNGRRLGSPGRGVIKDVLITREGMRVKR